MPAQLANTTSALETPRKLIYPLEESVRSKIPLWMKFYCYEYSSSALGRAVAYARSGGAGEIPGLVKEKAQIMVPAPPNFNTSTAHNYTAQATVATNILPPMLGAIAQGVYQFLPADVVNYLGDVYAGIRQLQDNIDAGMGQVTGFLSDIPNEVQDSTFTPSGPSRSFEIRMNLPCLTERDSKAAGLIVRAFEALSLPTARSLFTTTTTKYFHPPLWIFGIGPADSFKFDPDWTGSPQLSVLKSVSHKQTAYETNSLAALGYGGLLKPVSYTVTLLFQELEPAFRRTSGLGAVSNGDTSTGLDIINRSGVLVTTGSSIVPKVTQ